jgi:hypothetical protein
MVFFMEFLPLGYNDHTMFHMLRHFELVNQQAIGCVRERGYSNDSIVEFLKMPGSKFHRSFATDIKSLAERLKLGNPVQMQERKKYLEIIVDFNQTEYPEGIGTLGVCNRTELATIKASIPFLKMNRGWELWHAKVMQIPTTHQLTIVVKKQSSTYFLITAFPGLPSLPLPQKNMNTLDLELSKQYWEDKVFLEK